MSDLFRGRSSTWSAGTPVADGDPDSVPGYEYSDTSLAVQNTPVGASNNNAAQIDQISTGVGRPGSVSGFLYSPASSTHTTTELGSQEFSTARRLGPEKTPESSTSDCNNNYGQAFYTASSPRNSRDWTGTTSSGGGFQASNFSVHSVAASSPYGRHPESGGVGSSLLPPCGGPYESPSPYTNGQQQQQQQPGLHSGSPSSAGSQISCAQQPGINRTSVGGVGGIGSTSAQQSQPLVPANSVSGKRPARRNPWGSETYSDLIAKAIESYPEKQATLQQIYDYISTNYSFFRERSDPPASAGWKNSIRHNLSLHDKFIKCPKASESSKSSYWRLNANCLNRPYVRRRTCSLDTPGGGGASITGKKAKTRLGVGGVGAAGGGGGCVGMGGAAKRAVAIAAAAAAAANNTIKHSSTRGGGYADDMLSDLPNNRAAAAAAARSHLSSISSGGTSAFSAPGLGIKPEPTSILNNPWNSPTTGFGVTDRKLSQDEINFFHKMQATETGSSSSLSLVSGSYEFQVPRAPNAAASSSRSSISSGVGTSSSSISFCPPLGRYPSFSVDPSAPSSSSRYTPFCDGLPPQSSVSSCTSSQLSDILTRSAECLDGPGALEAPAHHHSGHHQPSHHFLRATDDMHPHQSMPHHPSVVIPGQITSSHLHNLLTSGDMNTSASVGSGAGSAVGPPPLGASSTLDDGGHQDALELQLSLALADRVRNDSTAVSSAVTQWATAATAATSRTVENGV